LFNNASAECALETETKNDKYNEIRKKNMVKQELETVSAEK